eukprot:TRINITY_DN6178_c0_g1_i1.p1 TRINITY_DN6178_c0_g1~~TRINITY_DN6178_c0_g1_i1.p1  ORF type:complete len:602 (-),score=64.24 TRINITY_DN6178_c0_g1_i1:56-1861(-)
MLPSIIPLGSNAAPRTGEMSPRIARLPLDLPLTARTESVSLPAVGTGAQTERSRPRPHWDLALGAVHNSDPEAEAEVEDKAKGRRRKSRHLSATVVAVQQVVRQRRRTKSDSSKLIPFLHMRYEIQRQEWQLRCAIAEDERGERRHHGLVERHLRARLERTFTAFRAVELCLREHLTEREEGEWRLIEELDALFSLRDSVRSAAFPNGLRLSRLRTPSPPPAVAHPAPGVPPVATEEGDEREETTEAPVVNHRRPSAMPPPPPPPSHDRVSSLAVFDGWYAVAGYASGYLRTWSIALAEPIVEVPPPTAVGSSQAWPVTSVLVGYDWMKGVPCVFVAAEDRTVRMVDPLRAKVLAVMAEAPDVPVAMAAIGFKLYALCRNGRIGSWNVITNSSLSQFDALGGEALLASAALCLTTTASNLLCAAHRDAIRLRTSEQNSGEWSCTARVDKSEEVTALCTCEKTIYVSTVGPPTLHIWQLTETAQLQGHRKTPLAPWVRVDHLAVSEAGLVGIAAKQPTEVLRYVVVWDRSTLIPVTSFKLVKRPVVGLDCKSGWMAVAFVGLPTDLPAAPAAQPGGEDASAQRNARSRIDVWKAAPGLPWAR